MPLSRESSGREQASGPSRAGGAGLQLEIVASLFVVMLAGLAIVAVVMASMSLTAVHESTLGRLELGAAHLERFQRFHALGLGDFAAFVQTQESRLVGGQWWVLDATGRPVRAASGALEPELVALARRAAREGQAASEGGPFATRVAIAHAFAAPGGERGVLLGRVPPELLARRFAALFGSLGWVLAMAAAVFVGFGSYLLRKRIVRPLQMLSAATRQMAAGDLAVRTEASGPQELAELARDFNELAASLARERDALLRASDSLLRSQRLAAVGQLAAGVAHEVGNPVAAVLGYAEVMLRDASLSERSRDAAERVRRESLRVRSLVRQLLDLARPQPLAAALLRPEALLRRAAELMGAQPVLGGIELAVEVPAGLPDVETDARSVEQILVNLIENAAHAVRGLAGARIVLSAASVRFPALPGRRSGDPKGIAIPLAPARLVELAVCDNGPGIDPDVVPHIFDPFFTTKEPGEGTGLGLWNAHRLAELLAGRLEVETAPGRTRFSLILPATDREDAARQDADSEGAYGPAPGSDHR
jgi:signal transduction histidine kinase